MTLTFIHQDREFLRLAHFKLLAGVGELEFRENSNVDLSKFHIFSLKPFGNGP
jgi:hypothetical protein